MELHWGATLRVTGRCMRPVLWLQILQPQIWANCWCAAKDGWQFVTCWQWQGVVVVDLRLVTWLSPGFGWLSPDLVPGFLQMCFAIGHSPEWRLKVACGSFGF